MKKNGNRRYWDVEEEEEIKRYILSCDDKERHKIYSDIIQPVFKKLIENIFYTYNFNKTLGRLSDIENDLLIHLYEKLSTNKFDIYKGTKSFSFFGTVAKNWLIQQSNQAGKKIFIDEETHSNIVQDISIDNYRTDLTNSDNIELIKLLIEQFDQFVNDEKSELTEDDKAIIEIVSNVLKNYELFNIYNKKQIYVYIREGTGLSSKKITKTIKKLRTIYKEKKEEFFDDGEE